MSGCLPGARGAFFCLFLLAGGIVSQCRAQDANALIRRAVETELRANEEDHSRWRYRDDERLKKTVSIVVQTDAGAVKRLMERDGKPVSAAEAAAVQANLEAFIHDPAKLEKQRRDGASDDKSAAELLQMMPDAFVWTLVGKGDGQYHLRFVPRPGFRPPDMEARVLGAMSGDVVLDAAQFRIATLSGRLTQDVTIGFGFLGRLQQGGTFRVERREIKPHLWQITETHVNIQGKALLFKSIGEQQDEVQTEWTEIPHGTTLEQALVLSQTLH